MKNVTNKLRVHHYPQVPCNPFIVDVADEQEAKKIMDVLAEQHLFLFANNIIPDYSNAITLVMWEDDPDGSGDWVDYWNDEEGMEWEEIAQAYFSNQHQTIKS